MKIIIGFILLVGTVSPIFGEHNSTESVEAAQEAKIDTFTFSANGIDKIFYWIENRYI